MFGLKSYKELNMENLSPRMIQMVKDQPLLQRIFEENKRREKEINTILHRKYKGKGGQSEEEIMRNLQQYLCKMNLKNETE